MIVKQEYTCLREVIFWMLGNGFPDIEKAEKGWFHEVVTHHNQGPSGVSTTYGVIENKNGNIILVETYLFRFIN